MRATMSYLGFCITFVAMTATAQTNTFPTDGNVGIGTTTPSSKLQVIGSANVVGYALIGQNTNGTAVIDAYNGDAYYGNNTSTNGIAINPAGYIGIGTTNPMAALDVGSPSSEGGLVDAAMLI